MFYTEFVTHQVDFAYFFSLILLMKTDNKINFSRSNYSAENSLRAIVVFFFQWFFKWKLFEYIYFFFQAKKLSSIFNSFGTAKRERWRLCNFFFCIWLCSCQELFFALFHCTAITIFYTDILTRKVDIAIFFRVWNGWNNCKTNCEW